MQFENIKISQKNGIKICQSSDYNYIFNQKTGLFLRWGKSQDDDPLFAPAPELLDLEISIGECLGNCSFCYKCNGDNTKTHHMTFDEFKTIIDKMHPALTQIAFGITNIYSNPDFFKMMEYAKKQGIVPNYTTHGLDVDDYAIKKTVELCGAVAVSVVNKEKTYDAVKRFSDSTLDKKIKEQNNMVRQSFAVNIHYMLSEETYDRAFKIIDDICSDSRLEKLNAIVFLQYKPKGRTPDAFHAISNPDKYKKLVDYCFEKSIAFGFDSCSAPLFMASIADMTDQKRKDMLLSMSEPCESGLFSSYINCYGEFFVCSFSEGEKDWQNGIDVLHCNNFVNDVWFHPRVQAWRNQLLKSSQSCICKLKDLCRSCPIFNVTACKTGDCYEDTKRFC